MGGGAGCVKTTDYNSLNHSKRKMNIYIFVNILM